MRVPVLSLHQGYASLTRFGDWGGWNARHHAAMAASPNLRVDLDLTNHYRFGIACEYWTLLAERGYITPPTRDAQLAARECFQPPLLDGVVVYPLIVQYAVAFLDTHLAGRPGRQHLLTPGHAQTRERFVQLLTTEPISPYTPLDHVHEFWFFPYQAGSATERADVSARPSGVRGRGGVAHARRCTARLNISARRSPPASPQRVARFSPAVSSPR